MLSKKKQKGTEKKTLTEDNKKEGTEDQCHQQECHQNSELSTKQGVEIPITECTILTCKCYLAKKLIKGHQLMN
jgi:hypothetical protein